MEWLETPLTAALPALFVGLFAWLATKKQIKAQTEREEHQWRRQVKSEPLKRLSSQIASMAGYMELYNSAMQFKQIMFKVAPSETGMPDFVEQATKGGDFYIEARNFQQALFQVDDTEIQEKAEKVLSKFMDVQGVDWEKVPAKEAAAEASKRFKEARQALIEIQTLINKKRLEEA